MTNIDFIDEIFNDSEEVNERDTFIKPRKQSYRHDEGYEKFVAVDLSDEFNTVAQYLSSDLIHANKDVFDAFDEIYHMLCIKQHEVSELVKENEQLRHNESYDPFYALLYDASKSINKTGSKRNATAAYNVLTRHGVDSFDSLLNLRIVEASRFRNCGSNILAVIATAQEFLNRGREV